MKGMLDRLAAEPETQVIVVQSQDDFDIVSRKLDKCVLIWDIEADEPHDFACLEGRDVIVLGELEPLFISKAGCRRLRYGSAPIPAALNTKWVSANIDTYPPENPGMRHVQPLIESTGQATLPAGLIPYSPAESDPVDPDLDSITGGLTPESIPEVPKWLETPPIGFAEPLNGKHHEPFTRDFSEDGAEWANPIDVLATARRQRIDPFEIAPYWMASYAMDHASRIGCDPATILASIPAALSGLVDDNYLAQPKRFDTGWKEHCVLWACICGPSSSAKNPGMEAVMKPLGMLNSEAQKDGAATLKKYVMDLEIYQLERKAYQTKRAKNESAQEPSEPEEPTDLKYFLCSDFTVEGLRKYLQQVRKALFYSDEASTLISGLGRYGQKGSDNADKGHLLGAYQGGERTILRGYGAATIRNWSASMLIGTTPSALRISMGGAASDSIGDGLMQRLLIACPMDAGEYVDRAPDQSINAEFLRIVRNLHDMQAAGVTVLAFDEEAVDRFSAFENRLRDALLSDVYSDVQKSHMAKFRGIVPRLSLLLQLCEHAKFNTTPTHGDKISAENVSMAIDYVEKFQWAQLSFFWGNVLGVGNKASAHVKWIAGHLVLHRYEQISLSGLRRAYREFCDLDDKMRAATLNSLCDYGWLRVSTKAKLERGCPTIYDVNPRIPEIYDGTEIKEDIRVTRAKRRAHLEVLRSALPLSFADDTLSMQA